jgi:hypothetical protein
MMIFKKFLCMVLVTFCTQEIYAMKLCNHSADFLSMETPQESISKMRKMKNGGEVLYQVYRHQNTKIMSELDFTDFLEMIDENGETALHHACKNGRTDIALELLTKCPSLLDVNNQYEETALFLACESKHEQTTIALINFALQNSHPHFLAMSNEKGKTPLHLACQSGQKDIILEFFKKNPELLIMEDNRGQTPLDLLRQSRQIGILEKLMKHNSISDLVEQEENKDLHKRIQDTLSEK